VSLTVHSHQSGVEEDSSGFQKTKILLMTFNPSVFKSKHRLVTKQLKLMHHFIFRRKSPAIWKDL